MLIGAATLVTVIGVIGALAWLNARDDSDLDHSGASAPGRPAPELTDRTLEQGNVIFRFADPADRAALRSLAQELAGGSDQALVNAGQAILVQKGDALGAEAYKRRLTVSSPDDPALTQFVEYWLGRNSLP
jgi:hypothetical protein